MFSQPKASSAGSIYAEELTSGVLKHTAYKSFAVSYNSASVTFRPFTIAMPSSSPLIEMGNQTIDQSGDGGFSTAGFATKQDTFSISNGQGNIF